MFMKNTVIFGTVLLYHNTARKVIHIFALYMYNIAQKTATGEATPVTVGLLGLFRLQIERGMLLSELRG